MTTRDSRQSAAEQEIEQPCARKSKRGFEIYHPENDAAWIATDLTVPLNDAA